MDFEKLLAENMLRFGIKNLSESDKHYIQEKVSLIREQVTPVKFEFLFKPGTYQIGQIPDATITKLYNDLATIAANIKTPKLAKMVTTIVLTASASTTGINVNSALYKSGIKTNEQLAAKRLETMTYIVKACLRHHIPALTEEMFKTNFIFKTSSTVGETTGITADISQTGEVIKNILPCGFNKDFNGVKGDASNNYVGYEYNALAQFSAGDQVTVEFNPKSVPDCFYIRMDGVNEVVSGFNGISDYQGNLNKIPDLVKIVNGKIAGLGGKAKLASTTITPGKGQGGSYVFPTFVKQPFLDKLTVVVFATLSGTVFNIKVTCTPGPLSKPLGAPTAAAVAKMYGLQYTKIETPAAPVIPAAKEAEGAGPFDLDIATAAKNDPRSLGGNDIEKVKTLHIMNGFIPNVPDANGYYTVKKEFKYNNIIYKPGQLVKFI
jgi:hypothetical protein